MRTSDWMKTCAALLLAGTFSLLAPVDARGQNGEQEREPLEATTPRVAAKFDEYGNLRHCDLTARLDNFAVTLQNTPGATGYIIGYDSSKKGLRRNQGAWQIKSAHYYLTYERGVDAGRVVAVNGGQRDIEETLTELWIVPEGATPPVAAAATTNNNGSQEFSGQFDVYATDENIYRDTVEMGWTESQIAYGQFAGKLKQQPESVGYLVIRPSKNSLPGAWRRIARRDEDILHRDHQVETARLKSINGGTSDDETASVELWILPKNAPPPVASATEKIEKKNESQSGVAFKLNTHDFYTYFSGDQAEESWMLENLAEMLRENPRASAYIVAREMVEWEAPADENVAATNVEQLALSSPQQQDAANADAAGAAAVVAGNEASAKEEAEAKVSAKELAERWKTALSTKFGIDAQRIVILQGRQMWQLQGRLTTWIVPEKATAPDPLARDTDEPEDDEAGVETESLDATDATEATSAPEQHTEVSTTPTVVPRFER
jgi:hypothetical protein